ncbi:HET-domain-containing protein, partial [Mollisia scopiformis]
MYTHHETYNERSIFGVLRTVPQDSASDSTFNLARTWLDDCLQNHPSCSVKKSDGTRHPARILDIESLLDNSAIKLIDFPINPISYVTLSYCWGSSVPLKTESHSLTQRQSGIEWSTLPRTFQDAVTITRRLGYRYLWIDSLCIIQDSPPDWQTESSKMADVYENSVVTIATLWASDCNSGCLNQRDISVVSIDHRMPDGVNQTVHVCEAHVHPVILNVPIASCPLYSRAWAFQERILSPRVLHYTDSEVVWECRSDLKCECGSIEFGMEVSSLERSKDLRETLMLVSEYCMRDLTFDADKLPAMSGIGKRLCRLEWGSYFAGL